MNVRSVLCVCTGNICRSPLAEGLFKRDAPNLTVSSAGIGAVVGGEMPEPAARIAERESLDLANHRGRQITSDIVRGHDVILVMEDGQKGWLTAQFPESRGRVFVASHWRGADDIADPYRQSDEYFEQIFQQLAPCIDDWIGRLAASGPAAQR